MDQEMEGAHDRDAASPPVRGAHSSSLAIRVTFAVAVSMAMWLIVWAAVGSGHQWLRSVFVPTSAGVASLLFMLRTERRFSGPARRFVELLPEIRAGRAPIEELSSIEGELAAVVPLIQDLFRDLKQHKTEISQLNEEFRQRIAGRTNALERQMGSLRTQATRDGLTGLYNRRMFDEFFPKMIERCIDGKLDLSLLMIDVDNFKLLNDARGHAAGDELLRDIAQLIRSGIREQDAPFRLGGDEFVIIVPNLDRPAATEVARRLIDLVDALAKPIDIVMQPRLSIGVASFSELTGKNAMNLIHLADKRLYEMKTARKRAARNPKMAASA